MQAEQGCCPPGSWPALKADYQPQGELSHLPNGQQLYRIGKGERVIIMLSDIFGAFNGRHQHIADTFAEWGYSVVLAEFLPELYEGPVGEKVVPYMQRQDQKKVRQTWDQVKEILEKEGHKQFFAAGFCWGVWKAWQLSAEGENILAVLGFHPAIKCENLVGGNEVELARRVKCPSAFYNASNDQPNLKAGGEIANIMKENFGERAETHQFADMAHGWVSRGDLGDEKVRRDNEAVLTMARACLSQFK